MSFESIDHQFLIMSMGPPHSQAHTFNDSLINELYLRSPNLFDDHPEPQLLATSSDNGILIPSSSTISLLNLSQEQLITSPKTMNNFVERRISSNASMINHYINQQRMQQYHKMNDGSITVPDSPNLDPVSIQNSPSRFWLSPPRTFSNQNLQQRSLSTSCISRNQINQLFTVSNAKRIGTPNLVPVQSQDPLMTPLLLNDNHADNYFNYNPIEEDEAVESESEKV